MNDDPLLPYLAEIVVQSEAIGIILSGGFGMRLKQYHLRKAQETGGRQITLVNELPEVRATQDLDLILNMQLWVDTGKAHALGTMLKERLNYETITHSWQLRKPLTGVEGRYVKLDLQARRPLPDEKVKVKDRPRQVGREMGTGISGLETPEAFAVEDTPILLTLPYGETKGSVLVPHPYAWLNLKTRAAYDWLREQRGEIKPKLTREGDSVRLKHVYDVYVLTAMLTEAELIQAAEIADRYAEHEEAGKTRRQAIELYATENAQGVQAAQAYARRFLRTDLNIDHGLFWEEGLKPALGI